MSVKDPEGRETAALGQVVDFRGKRVLEVGCGDGRLTWRYAPAAAQVFAIDPDEELIHTAVETTPADLADRVRFAVGDVVEMEYEPGSYDVALLSWSL
jgi:2-polyprenyl-3-methyl-5-hydroxy-6-metoxy-1,4-benzoquinol methylase